MIRVLGITVNIPDFEKLTDEDFKTMQNLETNEKIDDLNKQIKKIENLVIESPNYVGMTPTLPKSIDLLFKDTIGKNEKKTIIALINDAGFAAKEKGYGYVDERYTTENKFKGYVVSLPFDYVDKAICEMFERLGLEYVIRQEIDKNVVVYESDLGFQKLMFLANDITLGGGIEYRKTHVTINPARDYKAIIQGVEEDYKNWRKDHPDIVS